MTQSFKKIQDCAPNILHQLFHIVRRFGRVFSLILSSRAAIAAIFVWFFFQILLLALNVKSGVAPDETYHIIVSELHYKTNDLILKNTPETYYLGTLGTIPYLYHLIMGQMLHFNIFKIENYIYLRLLNLILAMTTLGFAFLLVRELTRNRIIWLCGLIIQSNILMFVFLSSAVTYDNAVNMLAVISTYHLIRFLKTYSRYHLGMVFLLMVIGALTKFTYLPIILIQLVVILFNIKNIIKNKWRFLARIRFVEALMAVLFVTLVGLNLQLYGNNILKYKKIIPSMEDVFGREIALKHYPQTQNEYEFAKTVHTRSLISLPAYVFQWFVQTESSVFGILAHLDLYKNQFIVQKENILLGFFLLMMLLNLRQFVRNKIVLVLFFMSLSYFFVIFYGCYSYYLDTRVIWLQGRYLFPMVVPFVLLWAYFMLFRFNNMIKSLIMVAVCYTFFKGGLIYFLRFAETGFFK